MRAVLVLFLVLMVRLRAESTEEKLEELGGEWVLKDGGRAVEIVPWDRQRIWVNGVDVRTEDRFVVHPGDTIDVWSRPNCYRYRFESITPAGVVLRRYTYASIEIDLGANRTLLQSGRLLLKETIRASAAELPSLIWEDPPNWVEMGPVEVYRSKGATH
jgi:hypothetical protein